jgi:hypothetical protein
MNITVQWLTAAVDRLIAFAPNLLAGFVILLVGWFFAAVLSRVSRGIARRLGFDALVAKLGLSMSRETTTASRRVGTLVYTIVMLVAVAQAARAWSLAFVADGLVAVLAYLPHAIAAAVVFSAAVVIGNWARDRMVRGRSVETVSAQGVTAHSVGIPGSKVLPGVVRGTIIAVGGFMALRELQIAPEIVSAAFLITIGAVATAAALAFGLGARDVAGMVAKSWWDKRAKYGVAPVSPTPEPPPRPGVTA